MKRRTFLRSTGLGLAGLAIASRVPDIVVAQNNLAVGRRAVVTTDTLNVRGGPGTGEPAVGRLDGDAAVDLLGPSADGAWWRVASGLLVGWVSAQYLEPTGEAATGSAYDLDLSFAFSRQLTDVWCEAADIEMWMNYRGQAVDTPSRGRQQAIWDWETTHNAGYTVDQWDCSPFAAASAAHQQMSDVGFDHFRYDDAMDESRLLAWLLANPAYREPSIALIWRGAHYVLVRGVRASADPYQDPDAQLFGFYVADPNQADRRWYGSDRYIPIETWLGELLLPVTFRTPHSGVPDDVWQGKYVAVQRNTTDDGPTTVGQLNVSASSYA